MNSDRNLLHSINSGRTFKWLPILDFYILREFLIPFSVLAFTFTLLFLIGDIFNDLSEFLEYKTSPLIAAKYFILKMPGNIRFVLPISVLLSCMYSIANLGRTREITAMRASGLRFSAAAERFMLRRSALHLSISGSMSSWSRTATCMLKY